MRKRLQKKGWAEPEIAHAEKVFRSAQARKHRHMQLLEQSLFWFVLAIGAMGVIIVCLLLIPIFLALAQPWSHLLVGFFGLLLGGLMVLTVKELHWLEHHHHIAASLALAVVGLFGVILSVQRTNSLKEGLGLSGLNDPVAASLVFFVCFIIPYAALMLIRRSAE